MTADPRLDFDDLTHTYTWGGRPVPGASELLTGAGLKAPPPCSAEDLEAAGHRGTMVHDAVAATLLGQTLRPGRPNPYLVAAMRATRELGLRVIAAEVTICDGRIAGTVDLLGALGDQACVPDWKTGAYESWQPLQTCIYADVAKADRTGHVPQAWKDLAAARPVLRMSVHLRDDGDYRVRWHNCNDAGGYDPLLDRRHRAVIEAALTLHGWRSAAQR